MKSEKNRPKARLQDVARKAHNRLKWILSATSATLTASFVVVLEAEL